jgi:hypothetical protein
VYVIDILTPSFRLGRYGGVQPIGSRIGSANVEGRTWELWTGMNGSMRVYSFVASNPVTNFNSDVKQFWNYLANTQGYPANRQYLLSMLILILWHHYMLTCQQPSSSVPSLSPEAVLSSRSPTSTPTSTKRKGYYDYECLRDVGIRRQDCIFFYYIYFTSMYIALT